MTRWKGSALDLTTASGKRMIVLGVDPGSIHTGYGVISNSGGSLKYIAGGILNTKPEHDFPLRLKTIYDGLFDVMTRYSPDECSIENIFYCKNVKSALKLGHTRGVIMVAAANHGLPVFEYSPTQIKQSVSGYGRASKEQVFSMVKLILNVREIAGADESDALAAAICHINSIKLSRALKR